MARKVKAVRTAPGQSAVVADAISLVVGGAIPA